MRFYQHLAVDYWREHPGDKAKLDGALARSCSGSRTSSRRGAHGSGDALDIGRRVVEPVYMCAALRARRGRALRRAARVRRARAAPARLPDLPRRSSSAQRATGSRGTSCSRCSQPLALAGASAERRAQPYEGRARPSDPRHRRLGAPPAHPAAGARERGIEPRVRRARRPGVERADFYDALTVPVDPDPVAARPRSAAARALRAGCARRRAHASRARRRLRRCRREASRGAARLDEAQRRSVPRRAHSGYVERGSRARARIASSRSPTRSRRFTVERVGVPRGQGRDDPLRARRPSGAVGREPAGRRSRGARVLLAVARLDAAEGPRRRDPRALAAGATTRVLVVLGEGPDRARARRAGARPRRRRAGVSARAAFRTWPRGFGARHCSCIRRAGRASASRVLEAMLAGLPVVATQCQLAAGARRRRRDGLLVRPDDPSALALGVARALEQPRPRRRRPASGRTREFSVARMADRTMAVYEAVLGQTPCDLRRARARLRTAARCARCRRSGGSATAHGGGRLRPSGAPARGRPRDARSLR